MLQQQIINKSYTGLILAAFILCIVSLITELLPEFEAKEIVIPTLIIASGLLMLDIVKRKRK